MLWYDTFFFFFFFVFFLFFFFCLLEQFVFRKPNGQCEEMSFGIPLLPSEVSEIKEKAMEGWRNTIIATSNCDRDHRCEYEKMDVKQLSRHVYSRYLVRRNGTSPWGTGPVLDGVPSAFWSADHSPWKATKDVLLEIAHGFDASPHDDDAFSRFGGSQSKSLPTALSPLDEKFARDICNSDNTTNYLVTSSSHSVLVRECITPLA